MLFKKDQSEHINKYHLYSRIQETNELAALNILGNNFFVLAMC